MTTPSVVPRGIEPGLSTCRELQCSSHGTCVPPLGGGTAMVCECDLGYKGEFCDDTIHGALSLPLTLGVLGAIVGLVILAFIIAKLQQYHRKKSSNS
ncbi:sushi, von Willebrand factor type A, EGF and pentraxin domain-containing protein 1-like [Solea solea]|uniref:sushi, von Willebrand factor type A, EGF and pentraxin domain-containing protein 1-like n=1 Tax=Solea solea TaxID=90069 RepID=UPI00272D3C70|nr:sushi, von Willebrand factor type A, EGF and pentraxin domain-containing protein 1-like [Solea solea]